MYTDISWLKADSSFKYLMETLNSVNNSYYLYSLQEWDKAVTEINGKFLPLALNALGMSNIAFFLKDGQVFFNKFTIVTTHEGLLGVLKSLFLSDKVTIKTVSLAVIDIEVMNQNNMLVAQYIDINNSIYNDIYQKNYIGFKSGDNASLESFFRYFLQGFLPAGVTLNNLTIDDAPTTDGEAQYIDTDGSVYNDMHKKDYIGLKAGYNTGSE